MDGSTQEKCSFYQVHHIPFVWEFIETRVENALNRGSAWSKEDIYDGLRAGELQLWTTPDAVLVTGILDESCILLVGSGDNMHEWLHFLEDIEEWAKDNGCNQLKIYGRKGWSKLLGFEITGMDGPLYVMRKVING